MKQKLVLGLMFFLLVATLTVTAYASWSINEGIDGYVYRCGKPAQGIVVQVYDESDMLVGYGVNDGSKGTLGTDITDVTGYFHIAWLEGHFADYTVVAKTPGGTIIGTAEVTDLGCRETRRICFCYCLYTIGYWKNHPEAWPVDYLTIGGTSYNKAQLLIMLRSANAKDATYMLAAQLIAAKLNIANGADPTSISETISKADAFLSTNPYGSNPRGADRSYALGLKDALDFFNNGY